MFYSQKQKEFLESFGINPQQLTTYQIFVTIDWIKKTNPNKEKIEKLKAKLEGRLSMKHPTKPAGPSGSGDEPLKLMY